MQIFSDFLSFKFFISPYILIVSYYIGSLFIVPVGSWFLASWLRRKYKLVSNTYKVAKAGLDSVARVKDRVLLSALFMLFLIGMEILWRMMFEFLIAYLQIRDALMSLTAAV